MKVREKIDETKKMIENMRGSNYHLKRLKRKVEQYKSILESLTETKDAVQIFRGSPSEVEYKCNYFKEAATNNLYDEDSMEIGKIRSLDTPKVIEGEAELIACIPYSYTWVAEGYTSDYFYKVKEEWESAKKDLNDFLEDNCEYFPMRKIFFQN